MEDKLQSLKPSRTQNLSFLRKHSIAPKIAKNKFTCEAVKEKWNVCSSVFSSVEETKQAACEDSVIEQLDESPLKREHNSVQQNFNKSSKLLKRNPVSLLESFNPEFSSKEPKLENATSKKIKLSVCSDRFHMDRKKNAQKKVKPCFMFTKDIGASYKIKSAPVQPFHSFNAFDDIVLTRESLNAPRKADAECCIQFSQSDCSKTDVKKTKLHNINTNFSVPDLSSNFSSSKEDVNVRSKSNLLTVALDRVTNHDISETEHDCLSIFAHKDSKAKQFSLSSFNNISSDLHTRLTCEDDAKMLEKIDFSKEIIQNDIENSVKSNFSHLTSEIFCKAENLPENIDIQYSSSQSQSDGINDSESEQVQNDKEALGVKDMVHSISSVNDSSTLNEIKIESGDKGSSWVHSLKWNEDVCMKDTVSNEEFHEKLKVKGFLSGGLAEKTLKLQRRIRSDKVIWDHKIHDIRNKACNKFLTLFILTILHCGEIIVTKCLTCSDEEKYELNASSKRSFQKNEFIENDNKWLNSTSFIVLFKKNDFFKFKLKAKQSFRLFHPWEIMCVPSIQYPVILCTHYLEAVQPGGDDISSTTCLQSSKMENENLNEVIDYVLPRISKNVDFKNELNYFALWNDITSVSGRLQRIWQHQTLPNVQILTSIFSHARFSFLLQTENNNFVILKLKSNFENPPKSFMDFISCGEGNCYRFHDFQVTYKYSKLEHPSLFQMLEYLLKAKCNTLEETFSLPDICYELFPNNSFQEPDMVSTEDFPPYFDFEIGSLSMLLQSFPSRLRFSCIAKVLCHIQGTFYVTDETLLKSQHVKYMRLQGCLNCRPSDAIVGKEVLIKEACFLENFLLLDDFSRLIPLHDNPNLLSQFLSRLDLITSISECDMFSPLHEESKIEDLVIVEGTIVEVNENSALSWLECCYCHKANLLQDNNSVIYCEDCQKVVSKPILNVKLEVTLSCTAIPSVLVLIQLLPSTIKRILDISDDTHQPQCSIGDVLNKKVNSLFCHVRHCEIKGKQKVFYLTEIS